MTEVRAAAQRRVPVRALMLAQLFTLPYRVLRCAAAAGAKVYVLGGAEAHELARSRYCAGYHETGDINGGFSVTLAADISRLCRELAIDIVMPSDAPSTRSLIAIREQLGTPCFPLPTLDQFDFLNDKWKFAGLCGALGIPHPPSLLYPDRAALESAARKQELTFPFLAKALSKDGSEGCVTVHSPDKLSLRLERIDYRPVVVQNFIPGEDIGTSVFCRRGAIVASIQHQYNRGVYTTFSDRIISSNITKIVSKLELDGVYNFDMRRATDGRVYYFECNPRFFYSLVRSMLAGINFVALGLRDDTTGLPTVAPDGTVVRMGKALLFSSLVPKALRMNLRVMRYLMEDPVPYLRERMRYKRNIARSWG